jgi:hypothetical protein
MQTNSSVYLIATLLSGLVAVLVSTFMEILYNRRIFRLQSFELFRREYDADAKLRDASDRFGDADQPMPGDFIELFLNFFETIGYFHAKNMVHRALVSSNFADDILDAYEHPSTVKFIDDTRDESRNQHYFEWFLYLAEWCELQENLEKASVMKDWFRIRYVKLPRLAIRTRWQVHHLWFGPTTKRTRLTKPVPGK